MTEKESILRSVVFLVVGILLLLSLVICIYIVNGEKDLVKITANIINVVKDADGKGKNDVTAVYEVNGTPYEYSFYYKDDVNVDDKIAVYYHSENATSVQTYKTPKIIFIVPTIGLVLCALGLFELYKKNKNDEDEQFKTSVIKTIGNTQQLKIETDTAVPHEYEKTPEEQVEPSVKSIKKEANVSVKEDTPVVKEEPKIVEIKKNIVNEKEEKVIEPKEENISESVKVEKVDIKEEKNQSKEEPTVYKDNKANMISADESMNKELPAMKDEEKIEKDDLPKIVEHDKKEEIGPKKEAQVSAQVENVVLKKVQENVEDNKKVEIDEADIKQVIKDVLKEVIKEVKEEKEPPKKVEQKRVLPNYYYISGNSLIYEEQGKEAKEVNLKNIKKVVRTINEAGNVVKLVVSNEEVKCVLTNMKNIDLEQVANLLHNKMRTIDENFKEEIEYKEY